jgi:beta-lactamase class A
MTKFIQLTILLLAFVTFQVSAQTTLRDKIQQIVSTKNAVVGVSIADKRGKEILSINGDKHFPFQSVFKFHIALYMLSEIDKGRFSLDQKIEISKKQVTTDLYSPIKDKYPEGATLTIAEIMEYTVSASDNVGCDVLLRLLGGAEKVENYFAKNKFKDISIKINEETQQANWDLQFQNWTTPKAANKVLSAFYSNKKKLLSKSSHDFVWKTMRETSTGVNRLKAQLPAGTIIAHKTGSSGTNKQTGITAAVNDIGVIFLPNGKHFYISVFVTDSKENAETNEKIIADIGKVAWDYFVARIK